jgi:hypothetical protein
MHGKNERGSIRCDELPRFILCVCTIGHLSTREKKEKKEKDIVRVNSIQIESIDKLRDFCPPERKQLLPDLLVGRNAAYISVLGDFCMN